MEEKKVEINTLKKVKDAFAESIAQWKEELASNFLHHQILPHWQNYNAVGKVRSVRRAIKRGRVDLYSGVMFPKRPFNNGKATKGREINELKKRIYGQYKRAAV